MTPCLPNLRTILGVGVGLALLAGCARAPIVPSVPPKPTRVTAEELLTKLREREAAVRTLKALFAVEASGGPLKATQRMEAALVYQRPRTIRLQGFARLGFQIFDLTLADGQYNIVFPMQGKSQKGSVFELDHKPGIGTPIILGLQATLGSLDTAILPTDQVALREEKGQYVLDATSMQNGATVARRLWFDQTTLEIVRQEVFDANGIVQVTMVYQNYRAVGTTSAGPLTWPSRVQAEDGLSQARMVLTFREVIPNPALTAEDWGPPVSSEPAGEQPAPKREN